MYTYHSISPSDLANNIPDILRKHITPGNTGIYVAELMTMNIINYNKKS